METISEYTADSDLIKLAITSEDVETEYIVTEEIENNPTFTLGDGYKKSKSKINEYLKNILGTEEIAYNFVETYVEEDNYLIINGDYVYFTKIKIPEKIYVAVKYEEENENFQVQIYEYDVSNENQEELINTLETGNINKNITNKYIITGKIENGNIKINTKTSL